MTMTLAITAAATLTCAAVGTALLRTRAQAWGLVDVPNERSMHTRVMPRGGGIVLVLAVLGGVAIAVATAAVPARLASGYIAAALLVAAIGWRDDVRSVAPLVRLLTHLVAAGAAIAVWGTYDHIQLPFAGVVTLPAAVSAGITLLWLVGLLNAYNFMDGIDGIASGQAVIAGAMWVLLCSTAAPLVTVIAAMIGAASLGFLWHNWAPARIFLGDAGSGFLGFSFAVLPLMAYDALADPRLPLAGLLIVAPFVFDTLFTLVRRIARGENLIEAHRTHLYQRMVISGSSHAAIATLYIGLAALSGGAAAAWSFGAPDAVLVPPIAGILLLPVVTAGLERRRL